MIAALLLALALGCDAIRDYRRSSDQDVRDFVTSVASSNDATGAALFDKVRSRLRCTTARVEDTEPQRAECRGKDDLVVSTISLTGEKSGGRETFTLTLHTFDSDRAASIVQQQLGAPAGETTAGSPGWRVKSGLLSAHGGIVRLERPRSGDLHDIAEISSEPLLPQLEEVLQRIHTVVDRRQGRRGASMPRVVAQAFERGMLPAEACVGDLVTQGRETCVGRALETENPPVLGQIHSSCVAIKAVGCDGDAAAGLLAEIIPEAPIAVMRRLLSEHRDANCAVARSGNFAFVVTQQRFPEEPWTFQHLLVIRRTLLTSELENALKEAANTPPPEPDPNLERMLEAVQREEERRPTSR